METEIIAEFEKNRTEKIKVSLSEFKGKKLVDIRIWYLNDDNEYAPSKKGVAISLELLPQLIEALQQTADKSSK